MPQSSINPSSIRLGLLDCWSHVGSTLELAEEADRLGFACYWLTEHPPQPNPQVLAALVAGVTERIRVGTAGILLNYHVPLQAAQQFLLLEHVYPGRIDAGFCAGGAPGLVHEALLDGRQGRREPGDFERRAAELIGWLRGDLRADQEHGSVSAWPASTGAPEIWSFGTGRRSAELAAAHGTAFGYSLFHQFSEDDTSSIESYRQQFVPAGGRSEPLAAIAVGGICAETRQDAENLKRLHQNTFLVPTIVGPPQHCREQIEAISERYRTTNLVFLDLSPDIQTRLRSIRMLAEEFGLAGADSPLAEIVTKSASGRMASVA